MKRAVILILTVLITALAVFAVGTSAQTTTALQNSHPHTDDVGAGASIITNASQTLLDVQSATEFDADEIKEDGINTRVATVWIVCICAVCFIAVVVFAAIMAKRNRGEK